MSSSTDCSDEDDDNQPSSLMKYWAEIRPSSTDEDSEPEVTPARTSRFEVSSSTECPQNENYNRRNENPPAESQPETTSQSQTSSMSHTNQLTGNIAPVHVPVHQPQTEETNSASREDRIENVNLSWQTNPVPDSYYRPTIHDSDQQFTMHQQWRRDRSDSEAFLLVENSFKDHCCWHWINSDQFRSCYRCFFCFAAFLAALIVPFWLALYYVFRN